MGLAFPLFAAILLFRFVTAEAEYQRARRSGATWYFPPGVGLRVSLGLGIPFGIYTTYRIVLDVRDSGDLLLPIATGILTIGAALFHPTSIRTDGEGVSEVRFLGIHRKVIPWEGTTASWVPNLREVLVIGSHGTVITHGPYHVGQREFVNQLRNHDVFVQE